MFTETECEDMTYEVYKTMPRDCFVDFTEYVSTLCLSEHNSSNDMKQQHSAEGLDVPLLNRACIDCVIRIRSNLCYIYTRCLMAAVAKQPCLPK